MQTLHTPQDAARWLGQRGAGRLCTDSRQVQRGDAFLAWPGARHDGRLHASTVLAQGGAACLLEAQGLPALADVATEAMAAYPHLKQASGLIAAAYYEHPSHRLDVVAITGTNGKTSSAWWLAQALTHLGRRCAVVGTLGMGEVQTDMHGLPCVMGPSTGLTTPDAVVFQDALHDFVQAGVKACAVEASSIGLMEHRLEGTRVRVALFTNFTQDHLDYHGSMAAYWQAKLRLFDVEGLQAAAVNLDDPQGVALVDHLLNKVAMATDRVWTFGESDKARLQARHIQLMPCSQAGAQTSAGLSFEVVEGAEATPWPRRLLGDTTSAICWACSPACAPWAWHCPTLSQHAKTCWLSPVACKPWPLQVNPWWWWTMPTRPMHCARPCWHCSPWRRHAAGKCIASLVAVATAMWASVP